MDWFTFQPGNGEATLHSCKRLAVRDAQYCGCTDKTPRKLGAGHYELYGCGGHQYWIVSKKVMCKEFPALMEQAYQDAF